MKFTIRQITVTGIALFLTVALHAPLAIGQISDGLGVRGGIGTDINGGIAYGGELNYTKGFGKNALQIGLNLFGGSFDESTTEGMYTYDETTDLFVAGVLANFLFSYSMETPGPYFVVGFGFGSVSVNWEERSTGDTSLGTPLPGGGSMQSADVTAGGTILNLGIGYRLTEQFDVRAQAPTFFIFGGPDGASTTVPTFTITAGVQF